MTGKVQVKKYYRFPGILPLAYDVLFLIFYFAFEPLIARFINSHLYETESITHYDPPLGWLFVAASAAQFAGAILLRRTIAFILTDPARKITGNGGFIGAIILIVMHFTIFGVLMFMDGLRYIFGDLYVHGPFINILTGILVFLLAMLPTASMVIVSFSDKNLSWKPVRDLIRQSAGLLLIVFSACVVTTAFWTLFAEGVAKDLHGMDAGTTIFILVLFYAVFLLLYLPPRYLLLIADYRSPFTWMRMTAVFLPFAWEVVTG